MSIIISLYKIYFPYKEKGMSKSKQKLSYLSANKYENLKIRLL